MAGLLGAGGVMVALLAVSGCDRLGWSCQSPIRSTGPNGSTKPSSTSSPQVAKGEKPGVLILVTDEAGKISLFTDEGATLGARRWDCFDDFTLLFSPHAETDLLPVNSAGVWSSTSGACEGGRWGYVDRVRVPADRAQGFRTIARSRSG
jgi:hypothetical protein